MTDDLDPKALDAAWRAFDACAAGGADAIRDEPWFLPAIEAAVIAARPLPDRGEVMERGAEALWDLNEQEQVRWWREERNRDYSPQPWDRADQYDRPEFLEKARAVLDAALGPATDQEREGT